LGVGSAKACDFAGNMLILERKSTSFRYRGM
jgi:hypothetical protein